MGAPQPLQLPAGRGGRILPCSAWQEGTLAGPAPAPCNPQGAGEPQGCLPSRPDPDMRRQHLAVVAGIRHHHSGHPFGPVVFAGITDKTRLIKNSKQFGGRAYFT